MEKISYHKVNDTNHGLEVEAQEKIGPGGAETGYFIHDPQWIEKAPTGFYCTINFQSGPPDQVGINGLTLEALLAVIIHNLAGLQAGPLACNEYYHARKHASMALECLHARTRERIHNGVEGQATR